MERKSTAEMVLEWAIPDGAVTAPAVTRLFLIASEGPGEQGAGAVLLIG